MIESMSLMSSALLYFQVGAETEEKIENGRIAGRANFKTVSLSSL